MRHRRAGKAETVFTSNHKLAVQAIKDGCTVIYNDAPTPEKDWKIKRSGWLQNELDRWKSEQSQSRTWWPLCVGYYTQGATPPDRALERWNRRLDGVRRARRTVKTVPTLSVRVDVAPSDRAIVSAAITAHGTLAGAYAHAQESGDYSTTKAILAYVGESRVIGLRVQTSDETEEDWQRLVDRDAEVHKRRDTSMPQSETVFGLVSDIAGGSELTSRGRRVERRELYDRQSRYGAVSDDGAEYEVTVANVKRDARSGEYGAMASDGKSPQFASERTLYSDARDKARNPRKAKATPAERKAKSRAKAKAMAIAKAEHDAYCRLCDNRAEAERLAGLAYARQSV